MIKNSERSSILLISQQEEIGLDELSRSHLVTRRLSNSLPPAPEAAIPSPPLVSRSQAVEPQNLPDPPFHGQSNPSLEKEEIKTNSGCHNVMSLKAFLVAHSYKPTAATPPRAIGIKSKESVEGKSITNSLHNIDNLFSLSLNQDLACQGHNPLNPLSSLKTLREYSHHNHSRNCSPSPRPSLRSSSPPPGLVFKAPLRSHAAAAQASPFVRQPTPPPLLLERKSFHWELSYDPTQTFHDSDVFFFADSSWKLILERRNSFLSSSPGVTSAKSFSSRDQQGGGGGGEGGRGLGLDSHNLLLYRFLPSLSCSHHTLTIACEFQIHCDIKSSYRCPRSGSPKVFVFPSRNISLLSSFSPGDPDADGAMGSNPQCHGYFGFISSSDLQRYVRDGKLVLSAELSLLAKGK
jgi:hypothetical protein